MGSQEGGLPATSGTSSACWSASSSQASWEVNINIPTSLFRGGSRLGGQPGLLPLVAAEQVSAEPTACREDCVQVVLWEPRS